ncbi:MAG: ABC transporter ATP-binding protein [Deltaproteobacteria bacterium]|nr:ABC transporter ATP-binding protein [Deltaproteobacteria bacterium]
MSELVTSSDHSSVVGSPPILKIENLTVSFGHGRFPAIRGVDFELGAGEILGLVGESGSGKSLTAFSIMGLLPFGATLDSGSVIFQGTDLTTLPPKDRRAVCGRNMGMVFQEPLTALNPVFTIGEQITEIFRHRLGSQAKEAKKMAVELLSQVGLPNPARAAQSYPHRFSGGMRQRVVIAMALALNPELVIADEPTTALDPTIAAQIIRLLKAMSANRDTAVLFITHNLRLLTDLAGRVLVMYAGLIVEQTSGNFSGPLHPYTKGLMKALPPAPSSGVTGRLVPISGQPPAPDEHYPGCPFEPRCPERQKICAEYCPPLLAKPNGRLVRCHLYQ